MSDYKVLRAADAPDYTGDAPGAFLGYGRPMGAEQIAFNVRVLEPGTTNVPPGDDPHGGHSHTHDRGDLLRDRGRDHAQGSATTC